MRRNNPASRKAAKNKYKSRYYLLHLCKAFAVLPEAKCSVTNQTLKSPPVGGRDDDTCPGLSESSTKAGYIISFIYQPFNFPFKHLTTII